jgi:hypothetical protein
MQGIFTISYGLLCVLVVLETLLLREILRKTVRYKRLFADVAGKVQFIKLSPGTRLSDFRGQLLGTNRKLSISDFLGHTSILLFINPESSQSYKSLPAAIHGMWQKSEGHLYLVCNGNEAACRQLVRDNAVSGWAENQVPVVLDPAGKITQQFLIDSTPQAVLLDDEFRVIRYGYPVPQPEEDGNGHKPIEDAKPLSVVTSHSATATLPAELNVPRIGNGNNGDCDWSDDQPSTGAGFARVDTTVSCVMTRFRLRSPWSLIPFYLAFRRVRRSSRSVPGLLKALFLIEDWRTCYTFSVWKNDCAIVEFGSIQAHIVAANSAFRPTWRKDLHRAEIWSAQFRLWAISAHNVAWEGLDLQTVLAADQWARREEVARHG